MSLAIRVRIASDCAAQPGLAPVTRARRCLTPSIGGRGAVSLDLYGVVGMGGVPLGNDLGLALVDVVGVDPFGSQIGVHAAGHARGEACRYLDRAILLADGPVKSGIDWGLVDGSELPANTNN